MAEDTNITITLKGLPGGNANVVIDRTNQAALAAGATIVVPGGRYRVKSLTCYLSLTESRTQHYITTSPVLELEPIPSDRP